MAQWWRCWHGAPTDPKWRLIAKAAKRPVAEVVAVAWAVIDAASQGDETDETGETRGNVSCFDVDVAADFLDTEPEHVRAILAAMEARRIVVEGRLRSWDKRQKGGADSSTQRVRDWREKKKADVTATSRNARATARNARVTDETLRNANGTAEQSRAEQSRAEQSKTRARDAAALPDHERESVSSALARDVAGILGARSPKWAMAGVTVAGWIAPKPEGLGLTAAQVREVARGMKARRDAAGEGPPNSAAYLQGAMADAAAGDDGTPTPRQEPRDFADIVLATMRRPKQHEAAGPA